MVTQKDTTPAQSSAIAEDGSFFAQFVRRGAWSVFLKIGHTATALALAIVLARALEPAGYGVYSYVYALVTLLVLPAMFGLPDLVVRETARAHAADDWATMQGIWRWSARVSAGAALGLMLMAGGIGWIMRDHFSPLELETFAWGLLLVPFLVLGNLRGAALRGLHKVLQGQLPEFILRPALLLGFVLVLLGISEALTPATAMASHVAAAIVAFAVGAWLLHRCRPAALRASPPPPHYESSAWIRSALPLAIISGTRIVNEHTDVIMLGWFTTSEEVGIYRVVAQSASLVAIGLIAINLLVAPQIVRLHARADVDALQRLVTISANAIFLISVLPALLFLFWGDELLRLVFGEPYAAGYGALAILAIGQIGNAAFGSVSLLLNMTGHERETARGVAIAAALNILLNFALIPIFGMNGAAVATAASLVLWNALLWHAVRRKLSINSCVLPINRPAS